MELANDGGGELAVTAEAFLFYPEDMGKWEAAVYLLSGCQPVWRALEPLS